MLQKLIHIIKNPTLLIFPLLIPFIVLLTNYYSGSSFISSLISALIFLVCLYCLIFLIFVLAAWFLYIRDILNEIDVKETFEKVFSFVISVAVTIIFSYLTINYAGFYIYETILKML